MNQQAQQDINRELRVLNHALESKNVSKTCRSSALIEILSINGKGLIKRLKKKD